MDHICNGCGSQKAPVKSRVLVISDLHFPFQHPKALDFISKTIQKYHINDIYATGDLLDNHYSSFHDTSTSASMTANAELEEAIKGITELAKLCPRLKVAIGNHDAIPDRHAFKAQLSPSWIKSIKEVLLDYGAPVDNWEFADSFIHGDNEFFLCHGLGGAAKNRMINNVGMSVVQGHYHNKTSLEYNSTKAGTKWAMQLGALVDDKSYAMAYAKFFPDSYKSVGVIIDGVPTIEFMD